MKDIKIYGHGSYIGTTGYNNHTRDFFRELSKHCKIKFRNFTVGESWSGYSLTPHDGEKYLTKRDKEILSQQTLWIGNGKRNDSIIYSDYGATFPHDINLILSETNHHYFYDEYNGPKIGYNVWESTEQPYDFFNKLLEYDEIWVPSEWQKECTINQGFDEDRVKVVPEGVDVDTFYPEKVDLLDHYKDGRFKFILFGRWDYRKSTREIIETFLRTFSSDEPVDLIVSVDNMWGEQMDGHKTTYDRLKAYDLLDDRVKVLSFPSRTDYIKYLKTGHVFLSCARSEGWNLPLIESMACGTPSIYSECSAQLEFAKGKGIPVKIVGEKAANENDYGRYKMSDLPGNYYEPDFNDLSKKMRIVYENYDYYKNKSLEESKDIRKNFNWQRIGEIGYERLKDFYDKVNSDKYESPSKVIKKNRFNINYIDGPFVEVLGDEEKSYLIEFIDSKTNEVVHSSTITNNMWTKCNRKYYTDWIIRINGKIESVFNLNEKRVLISLESSSIGDTIAWTPYVVEFSKKHNCKVLLSTFHNEWFDNNTEYDNIDFVLPGSSVNCYASYKIGWFRDNVGGWENYDLYPNRQNSIPLQQTSSDILGLPFKELNLGLSIPIGDRPIKEKYIVIGPQATSGCKEWVYDHWVSLSNKIKEKGYTVVSITKNPFYIDGVENIFNESWEVIATYLHHSEFLIGLGSGLSWFNWSLGKFTYMINGFSEDGHEFTTNIKKITNNICIKCWNDPIHTFDSGDWDWCPVYKGSKRQHICQKSITPSQVLNVLEI